MSNIVNYNSNSKIEDENSSNKDNIIQKNGILIFFI